MVENDYEGYGVFGGKDYYELLDEMNRDTSGARGDRDSGIDIAFGERPFIAPCYRVVADGSQDSLKDAPIKVTSIKTTNDF